MSVDEGEEENLDGMVSIWAGSLCFKDGKSDNLLTGFKSQ